MDDRAVAEAIGEWLTEDLDVTRAYPYAIANAVGPLPDAVVHITDRNVTDQVPEEFPEFNLQQAWARIYAIAASIMVKLDGQEEDDAKAADGELRDFATAMELSIWEDAALGGRLVGAACSPRVHFDFSTPFSRREDGVTGRFMVAELSVCEPIAAPG